MSTPRNPPAGRLLDGTAFYGVLGVLARDEDAVQCHLCGKWFGAIGGSHLRQTHGWTLDGYRDAFQLPRGVPSVSRSVSHGLSVQASGHVKDGTLGLTPGERLPRGARPLRPWQTLAAQNPALADQLDAGRNAGVTGATIAAGSNRKVWWRCPDCDHGWQATVNSRNAGHGCPACYAARRFGPTTPVPGTSLADALPDLAAEWDRERNLPLSAAMVRPGSHHKAWWRCPTCEHTWQATVDNRAREHDCPRCGVARRAHQRAHVPPERSLPIKFPELAAELRPEQDEPLDVATVAAFSSKRVWWRCPTCEHEWQAAISNRTAGHTGCPACVARRRGRAIPS